MTREEISRIVESEEVEFVRLQFTDIFGQFKNISITASQLGEALENDCMFDGSSIEGFVRVDESDMYLHPDLDTFEIIPWRPQQGKVARLICDVYLPDGTPFSGDPRYILRKAADKAYKMGYNLYVGPEFEFFLFSLDENGRPDLKNLDRSSYFEVEYVDTAENARRDIILNLEDMGYEIESCHHEISPSQHEIDFKYINAMAAADEIMTFKMAAKAIAKRHGLYATFMPKPIPGENGSGMHINMSLSDRKGKNLFIDTKDPNGISKIGYQFMAGIMSHIQEIILLTNPIVNSYKRLVPGYDAPTRIAWSSRSNRSELIRIPSQRGDETRIELRCPDSAANPYFAIAACLMAGLDGIEKKMKPMAGVDRNLYDLSKEELDALGIKELPATLGEAVQYFEKSAFARELLGDHAFEKYLAAKKREWEEYSAAVTDWEMNEYLMRF